MLEGVEGALESFDDDDDDEDEDDGSGIRIIEV
jgi:hypothetical protein